eukprot:m.101785 g.101785  ORF g.101785 m.101785 type:complete len:415 (-) comp9067_c1_seq1:433-1677(-)
MKFSVCVFFVMAAAVIATSGAQELSADRYRRTEIDPINLAAEIDAIIANVQEADLALSSVQSQIPDVASEGRLNTFSGQVSFLREVASDRILSDEVLGLANLITNIASTASIVATVGDDNSDRIPIMTSLITVANSLATDMFVLSIEKRQATLYLDGAPVSKLNPQLSTVASLETSFADFSASSRALLGRIEAMSTALSDARIDLGTFANHFGKNHFGNHNLPIFRWAQWSTYNQNCCWYWDNRSELNGGVAPSNWGDNNYIASQMSEDVGIMRALFNKRVFCGWSCAVSSKEWYSYSSTNSLQTGAFFRINNPTASAIRWIVTYYYSSYSSYAEQASVSLNHVNQWNTGTNCGRCVNSISLIIPPNRISTVIFISSSSADSGSRTNHLSFINNSLKLPEGLVYMDDLDYISTL